MLPLSTMGLHGGSDTERGQGEAPEGSPWQERGAWGAASPEVPVGPAGGLGPRSHLGWSRPSLHSSPDEATRGPLSPLTPRGAVPDCTAGSVSGTPFLTATVLVTPFPPLLSLPSPAVLAESFKINTLPHGGLTEGVLG